MTSENAAVADPDTSAGKDFRPKLRPLPNHRQRTRWTTTQVAVTGSVRGEHLGSPRPDHRRTPRESWHPAQLADAPTQTGETHNITRGRRWWKQPATAASRHRHRTARRRTSAALRPRERSARWNTMSVEAADSHTPPPNSLGNHQRWPNPSPALSLGKVGSENHHPTTSHRRPHRGPPWAGHHLCNLYCNLYWYETKV
jgi:hypothetical protein